MAKATFFNTSNKDNNANAKWLFSSCADQNNRNDNATTTATRVLMQPTMPLTYTSTSDSNTYTKILPFSVASIAIAGANAKIIPFLMPPTMPLTMPLPSTNCFFWCQQLQCQQLQCQQQKLPFFQHYPKCQHHWHSFFNASNKDDNADAIRLSLSCADQDNRNNNATATATRVLNTTHNTTDKGE